MRTRLCFKLSLTRRTTQARVQESLSRMKVMQPLNIKTCPFSARDDPQGWIAKSTMQPAKLLTSMPKQSTRRESTQARVREDNTTFTLQTRNRCNEQRSQTTFQAILLRSPHHRDGRLNSEPTLMSRSTWKRVSK